MTQLATGRQQNLRAKVHSATALVTEDVETEEAFSAHEEFTEDEVVECIGISGS